MNDFQLLGVGCDHAGFALKEVVMEHIAASGYSIIDHGTFDTNSVDYPDVIHPLASAVSKGEYKYGIIICGSGNGVSMTANKYPGVRAALCWQWEIAEMARLHNDANILALPARYISVEDALKVVDIFLKTEFEGGRHLTRVNKINICP